MCISDTLLSASGKRYAGNFLLLHSLRVPDIALKIPCCRLHRRNLLQMYALIDADAAVATYASAAAGKNFLPLILLNILLKH